MLAVLAFSKPAHGDAWLPFIHKLKGATLRKIALFAVMAAFVAVGLAVLGPLTKGSEPNAQASADTADMPAEEAVSSANPALPYLEPIKHYESPPSVVRELRLVPEPDPQSTSDVSE